MRPRAPTVRGRLRADPGPRPSRARIAGCRARPDLPFRSACPGRRAALARDPRGAPPALPPRGPGCAAPAARTEPCGSSLSGWRVRVVPALKPRSPRPRHRGQVGRLVAPQAPVSTPGGQCPGEVPRVVVGLAERSAPAPVSCQVSGAVYPVPLPTRGRPARPGGIGAGAVVSLPGASCAEQAARPKRARPSTNVNSSATGGSDSRQYNLHAA